jgi:hypothetical protein
LHLPRGYPSGVQQVVDKPGHLRQLPVNKVTRRLHDLRGWCLVTMKDANGISDWRKGIPKLVA